MAVVVTTPPNSHLTQTAFEFINESISSGVNIKGVFFYQSGVLNASKYLTIPNDEFPLKEKWRHLNAKLNIPLYLCSTAAEKHGLINETEIESKGLILSCFTIAGLGELVDLTCNTDKLVQL